jgi:hypothetical protein
MEMRTPFTNKKINIWLRKAVKEHVAINKTNIKMNFFYPGVAILSVANSRFLTFKYELPND